MKKLKEINWNHLYCFYEIAKGQSLKDASAHLGVAPSTMSEQLKKLEAKLGLSLFTRTSKGLMLTRDGEKVYEHCREIFEAGSRLLDNISHSEIGGYPVTVGIEETLSYDVSTEFISQYWDLFAPFGTVNTSGEKEHDHLVESLLTGAIDWGISLKEPSRKSISSAKIGAFDVVFCCSKELFNRFYDPKDILRNIPLAISSWDNKLNRTIERYLREEAIHPKEYLRSDHLEYIRKLCFRGRCVMFEANNPMQSYPELERFHVGKPLRINLFALWKSENENMISIKKLKELIYSHSGDVPDRYTDHGLQIEVSEVSDDLLKESDKSS